MTRLTACAAVLAVAACSQVMPDAPYVASTAPIYVPGPTYVPVQTGPTYVPMQSGPTYVPVQSAPAYYPTSAASLAAPAVPVQDRYVPAETYAAPALPSWQARSVRFAPAPLAAPVTTVETGSFRAEATTISTPTVPAYPAPVAYVPTVDAVPQPERYATRSAPEPVAYETAAREMRSSSQPLLQSRQDAFAKDRPQSAPRRFRAIGGTQVAELATERRSRSVADSIPSAPGLQVTTADPFSISTATSGQPYYMGSTPPAIEYHIPHIPQEEPLWCWAAAAQQAIGWVNNGRAPAQCAIVALAHGLDVQECCNDREGICARTGEIPAIATLVERFGGQARELASVPRDPQTVYDILRKGDTLLIRLRPAPHDEAVGIRHMIVVRGIEWLRLPNNQLQATLLYNDPLGAGERAVNFDEIEGFFEQALVVSRT